MISLRNNITASIIEKSALKNGTGVVFLCLEINVEKPFLLEKNQSYEIGNAKLTVFCVVFPVAAFARNNGFCLKNFIISGD